MNIALILKQMIYSLCRIFNYIKQCVLLSAGEFKTLTDSKEKHIHTNVKDIIKNNFNIPL